MEDGVLYGFPDMRTTRQPVSLSYEDDGEDSPKRFFPFTRRPKDAEPKLSPDEEFRLMEQQVEESKGFDIDFSQFRCLFNYLPVPFEIEHNFLPDETISDLMDRLSREALNGFNEKHNTRYEFVKVLKANYHHHAGIMFYITFEVHSIEAPEKEDPKKPRLTEEPSNV